MHKMTPELRQWAEQAYQVSFAKHPQPRTLEDAMRVIAWLKDQGKCALLDHAAQVSELNANLRSL